jgi:drug/metabolite transporter (DMT)-like permease
MPISDTTVFRAYGAVFFAAVFGGLGFVFMKNALDVFALSWFVFWRFFSTSAALFPFLWKKLVRAPRQTWKDGAIMGALFFVATMIQSAGIAQTGAGRSAFINNTGIVVVPLLQALVTRKAPTFTIAAGCLLCFVGVGILTWPKAAAGSGGWAEMEVFVGTCIFACRMIFTQRASRQSDPNLLSFVEFGTLALLSLPPALLSPWPVSVTFSAVWGVLYMGLIMNVAALMVINSALRVLSPTSTTVILSTQALYAAVGAYFLLGEAVTPRLFLSGVAIASGIALVVFDRH